MLGVRVLEVEKSSDQVAKIYVGVGMPDSREMEEHKGHFIYFCKFQILGFGDESVREALGVDGLDAIRSCLIQAGSVLAASDAAKAGKLSWVGGEFPYGFLVPDSPHVRKEDSFLYVG